jgi:hypothetical protein
MIKDQKPSGGCNNCGTTSRLQLANGEWLCADCRKNDGIGNTSGT